MPQSPLPQQCSALELQLLLHLLLLPPVCPLTVDRHQAQQVPKGKCLLQAYCLLLLLIDRLQASTTDSRTAASLLVNQSISSSSKQGMTLLVPLREKALAIMQHQARQQQQWERLLQGMQLQPPPRRVPQQMGS